MQEGCRVMKFYLIDEISHPDMEKITKELEKVASRSGLEKIIWVEIPKELLSKTQIDHSECRPHVFALELGPDWIRLEFFVRSLQNMRCPCNGYSTPEQVNFTMNYADRLLERLGVRT